jgi:hypothetical protein
MSGNVVKHRLDNMRHHPEPVSHDSRGGSAEVMQTPARDPGPGVKAGFALAPTGERPGPSAKDELAAGARVWENGKHGFGKRKCMFAMVLGSRSRKGPNPVDDFIPPRRAHFVPALGRQG